MRIRDANIIGAKTTQPTSGVLVQVNDPAGLVRSQGGLAASAQQVADMLNASSITTPMVYSSLADQLKSALAAQKVDATVTVVDPAGYHPARGIGRDIAVGLAVAGVVELIAFGYRRLRGKRK